MNNRVSSTSLEDGVGSMSVTSAPTKSSSSSSSSSQSSSAPAAAPPKPAAPTVDPKFAPYAMMRKLLPEPALRHKMTADGFSDAEIDNYFAATAPADDGGGAPTYAPPPPPTPAAPAPSKTDAPPPAPSKLPPKATGGRANLLADIAKRRVE